MTKKYHLGHRIALDWRKKRLAILDQLLEEQEQGNGLGKKFDYFAGMLLFWVFALVFFYRFFAPGIAVILSLLGPVAFSYIYHSGKRKKQQLIAAMKRERGRKSACMQHLQDANRNELDKLTIAFGEILELEQITITKQGFPVMGLKGDKKVALYLFNSDGNSQIELQELKEVLSLAVAQGAIGGVLFSATGFSDEVLEERHSLPIKVKLVNKQQLLKLLRDMEHPFYTQSNQQGNEKVREHPNKGIRPGEREQKLIPMFVNKPALVGKYLLVAVILSACSLLVGGWFKIFYLMLAAANLALASYTYYVHLPVPGEDRLVLDDL